VGVSRIRSNLTGVVFVVGLLVATALLWITGVLADTWDGLVDAQPLPLALVVVVGMTLPLVHAWRWQVVMRSLGVSLTLGEACDITVSSALINYASPGFVGASAKAVLANQTRSVPYSSSALSIGFEHTLDLTLMAASAGVAILIIGPAAFRDAASPLQGLASAGVVAGGLAIVAIALTLAWRFGALRYIRSLGGAARTLGRQVNPYAVGVLTLLYWFLQIVVTGLMFWALGIDFIVIDVLGVVTVPGLAGMIAPLPGGVGVREAVTVALTTVTGIGAATLVTLAIVQRVLLVASLPLSLGLVRIARGLRVRFV
jgi:uncharacterized membrane protein YbhN (UPF0104 family)